MENNYKTLSTTTQSPENWILKIRTNLSFEIILQNFLWPSHFQKQFSNNSFFDGYQFAKIISAKIKSGKN